MSKELSKNLTPVQKLKSVLNVESVREQFRNALKENANSFVASLIDLYASDKYLQECNPNQVVMEALKAATLKLPINKQLGFAYIVPYKKTPQFQLGYKGYIQLAMRTGQYKYLNTGIIYEGMEVKKNILTGQIEFSGEPKSDKAIGYFAYMELLNGFSKTLYMTKEEIINHAKRYSKSYGNKNSAWATNFDEMAMKTVTRLLLSKFGILSTDMIAAFTSDTADDAETVVAQEIEENANKEVIDIQYEVEKNTQEEKQKQENEHQSKQQNMFEGPGF